MDEQRIQKQIAIYMTDKKLCEFNDKLKLAPVDYYAHVHAQGEKQEDGSRQRSCIGMVLQWHRRQDCSSDGQSVPGVFRLCA